MQPTILEEPSDDAHAPCDRPDRGDLRDAAMGGEPHRRAVARRAVAFGLRPPARGRAPVRLRASRPGGYPGDRPGRAVRPSAALRPAADGRDVVSGRPRGDRQHDDRHDHAQRGADPARGPRDARRGRGRDRAAAARPDEPRLPGQPVPDVASGREPRVEGLRRRLDRPHRLGLRRHRSVRLDAEEPSARPALRPRPDGAAQRRRVVGARGPDRRGQHRPRRLLDGPATARSSPRAAA